MKSFLIFIILIINTSVFAAKLKQDLRSNQIQFLKNSPLNRDQIGFVLIDTQTNKIIESFNSNKAFLPASLSKIPTTYFALKTLGPNFKFKTKLSSNAKIDNGVLKGDLYLHSNGDPFLTNSKLQNLILELKIKGINSVSGNFYYDASALPQIKQISEMGLGDQTYNTGLSALNVEFNRFQVWRYGKTRRTNKSDFKTIPAIDSIEVKKVITPFTPGKRFKHNEVANKKEVWEVSHQQRYKRLEEIPIRNTARYTATYFRYLAKLQGIQLKEPQEKVIPKLSKVLASLESLPLSQLVAMALEYSNNLFTEVILLTTAKNLKGKVLNLKDSALVMKKWMQEKFPNDNWGDSYFENGSGLSVNNKIRTITLAKFFQSIKNEKIGNDFFWSYLSLSGQSGWMRKRLNDPDMSYRVWAKTGSLDYISNLSGYLMTNKGKRLAFAFYGNDFEKRLFLQRPNNQKVNRVRKDAKKWRLDTMQTMDKFLRDWVSHY
jgi:D-alanyl-D-alanine carboxypeptidase/D-alanyl-D-alanine-endopeptidase (penicillin-binding protein 4)